MEAVKVQFKKLGKKYFFSIGNKNIKKGDFVVVSTIRGLEVGEVVSDLCEIDRAILTSELKEVVRKASFKDLEERDYNKSLEEDIINNTKKIAKSLNLEIKVLEAEYTLDRSKLIIYFEADGRIDFRDLVRELADLYKTRIELRQVGSRDGAKVFGGVGPCGLVICCKTFLTEFSNVSIKMAKNQSLSLNPAKISGICDKLLCCINYENDIYTELRKNAPDIGDIVSTELGDAKVLTSDVLNRSLKVKYFSDDTYGFLNYSDVKFIKKEKYKKSDYYDTDEDLKDLE